MAEHLQITFRHMPVSAPLRELIHDQAEKLQHRYEGIGHCHVVVDAPPMTSAVKSAGRLTHVLLEIGGQHGHLAATCNHEDAHAGVRDAFNTIARQIVRRNMRATG